LNETGKKAITVSKAVRTGVDFRISFSYSLLSYFSREGRYHRTEALSGIEPVGLTFVSGW
jgi:hypothetical protein